MQIQAEFTPSSLKAVTEFIHRATGVTQPTELQMQNALYLVSQSAWDTFNQFRTSAWHTAQKVHTFEALVSKYAGTNSRWSPLSLNLHFSIHPSGYLLIGTPEEMPVDKTYFVKRVIADSQHIASSPDGV